MFPADTARLALVETILSGSTALALATIRPDGAPHVTTVSYASEGLLIYAAIAIDCHKAYDIARDQRVSLTVNAPYSRPEEIRGVSIDATAHLITDVPELALAAALLAEKAPEYADIIAMPHVHPWPGMLFIRITPHRIILLDYTLGFGHTEVFHPVLGAA